MNGVLQVEMGRQCGEIVGVMIHVVAFAGLARAAVAPPVVGDDTEAAVEEGQRLRVPIVGRKRSAVAEHDRLPRTPVLVEDFGSVLGGDRGHV